MTIWFTADTHWNHQNILKYCNRPFKDVEEQTETMITNWNSVVSTQDHVYHLGDVGFGSPDYLYRVMERLRGRIYLIRGNHDSAAIRQPASQRFKWIKDTHLFTAQMKNTSYRIFLSHYPHRSWPDSYKGSYHLFGHTHGNLPPHGLSFDVGVDCNNYLPISLEQVVNKMSELSSQLTIQPKPDGK